MSRSSTTPWRETTYSYSWRETQTPRWSIDEGSTVRPLTFRMLPGGTGLQTMMEDQETGSKWTALTGAAIEGPLTGKTLDRALSHLSFWFAWKDWHPDTELYLGSAVASADG